MDKKIAIVGSGDPLTGSELKKQLEAQDIVVVDNKQALEKHISLEGAQPIAQESKMQLQIDKGLIDHVNRVLRFNKKDEDRETRLKNTKAKRKQKARTQKKSRAKNRKR